jgi:hypothetical protein
VAPGGGGSYFTLFLRAPEAFAGGGALLRLRYGGGTASAPVLPGRIVP